MTNGTTLPVQRYLLSFLTFLFSFIALSSSSWPPGMSDNLVLSFMIKISPWYKPVRS